VSPGADGKARRFVVPASLARAPLDRSLRTLLGDASWGQVRRLIQTGKVALDGVRVLEPTLPVRQDQVLEIVHAAPRPDRQLLPNDVILFADTHVVVANKPSGISTVPFEPSERDTFDQLVARLLSRRESSRRGPLGIVHRLDKETSGVLVFARTLAAKRELKNQFRFHTVKRRYVAIAHGSLESCTLSSRLVEDRGDGMRGSTDNPTLGRAATTHVRALEGLRGATLVECRLETGRTHQIRIHLAEAGHPVVGERVYVRDHRGPLIRAPRVMLHAAELGFEHPATRRPMHFESAPPEDLGELLRELRR